MIEEKEIRPFYIRYPVSWYPTTLERVKRVTELQQITHEDVRCVVSDHSLKFVITPKTNHYGRQ